MDEEMAREIVHRWIRESPSLALKMICGPEIIAPLIRAIAAASIDEGTRQVKPKLVV